MAEKVENFLVNITVIEGRHLVWLNMDSAVHVRVDNQRKCTGIRYTTDSPFFNEYFVFEFATTLQTLIDKTITLTVIQPRKACRSKKTLGYITLDMATVWTQPDHQFYHKWAIISAPISDPAGAPRGYLKVDINIVKKGELSKIPVIETQDTDEIEGNLMLPDGLTTERQRANYVLKVYRAADLCKTKYVDLKYPPSPERDPPSPFVEVCFAGLKAKTSTKRNTTEPVWNESLILTELFPPLCQRIKIYLRSAESCQDSILGIHHINLRSISSDKEHGFLPTFGPAFVHFYGKGNTSEGYIGRVLMSFTTELQVNVGATKSIKVDPIPALHELNMWKIEPVVLFGVVFNANLIDKKYSDKPISFEISCGRTVVRDNKYFFNRTNPQAPMAKGKLYWYLEYGQDKPCLFNILQLPDFRKRMHNSNVILKIVEELKLRLNAIGEVLTKEEYMAPSGQLENLLLDITDFLSSACRKYIDITQADGIGFETQLDKERKKLSLREMEEIENIVKEIYNPMMKRRCYELMLKLLRRLESLTEDEQDCWPDIYISMISGSKRVAFTRCPVKNFVYSVVEEEKGKHCGTLQSLFLKPKVSKKLLTSIACKLDIILWIGLERHRNACAEIFPPGFILPGDVTDNTMPPYLVAQEKYYFQCRAHIYQGKFLPGSDRSGLCDPFARVIIGGDCRETVVSQATLHPVWDQSLVFTKLVLYGTKPYIRANPPLIVLEVFDQDECCKTEFVGRCLFHPAIKFVEDSYSAPIFPPKLKWYNITKGEDVLGEVLVLAELLELSGSLDEPDLKPTNEIVRIPSDIKPKMVKYRIEVIFWGVRELKRVNCLPITKPKVILECAYMALHSDTILGTKKNLNFTRYHKLMDVNLPEQEEYSPPICIKMFDCRSFGRYTLAGTHIVSITPFLYQPVTLEERNRKFEPQVILLYKKPRKVVSIRSRAEIMTDASVSTSENVSSTLMGDSESSDPCGKATCRDCGCKTMLKSVLSVTSPENQEIKSAKCSKEMPCQAREPRWKSFLKKLLRKLAKPFMKKNKKKAIKTTKSSSSEDKTTPKKQKKKKEGKTNTPDATKVRGSRWKRCFKVLCCLCLLPFACFRRKRKERKRNARDGTADAPKKRGSCLKIFCKILFCWCLLPFYCLRRKKSAKVPRNKFSVVSIDKGSARGRQKRKKKNATNPEAFEQPDNEEETDWWTKYNNSVESSPAKQAKEEVQPKNLGCKLKLYTSELESQPEFEGFSDVLQTFQMYKGKRTGDETVDEENILGIFKGAIKIYRWPQLADLNYVTPSGLPLMNGAFQDLSPNDPVKFVVRIYCVKGLNLRPKDASGKSDPYLCVTMGKQTIKDRKNYIPQQINPVFGRCFELQGTLSLQHAVTVSVWDWDLTSSDDLIGETKIDIENRYYTRHRAHCGIASQYREIGYCWWREHEKPVQILDKLCKSNNIDPPHYSETSVRIMNKEYGLTTTNTGSKRTTLVIDKHELALCALHHWQEIPVIGCHLVPEHIETRALYHPAKPGIEQGKLQLWVDLFPCTDLPPPQQVDISPRKPVAYELRVIVWNTDEVILDEDDFFVGERMSDIYVKGWITSPNESQCTDVHYRSMTGEGSFNWRLKFRFKYISTENKLVVKKKESIFSVDETEHKMPCRLTLQVWDNDTFSADDFLGSVTMELSRLPRGARSADKCVLDNLAPTAPTLNLFKIKRTKGWWPFRGIDQETQKEIVAGKLEMELELLTEEEAEKNPAGFARAEPQPLPRPTRPDTSFSWFKNPLKALKFLICKHYRWRIIKCAIFLLLVFGIVMAVYSVPGYSVKKLLGV